MLTPSNAIQPQALNEIQAAAYIGMSRSFLAKSRMSGNRERRTPAPRFIKIGKHVRYLRAELDAWLTQHQKLEFLDQIKQGA